MVPLSTRMVPGLQRMNPDGANTVKHSIDIAAAAVAGGAVLQVIPAIASVLTVVWLVIRIWETETVRRLTRRGDD